MASPEAVLSLTAQVHDMLAPRPKLPLPLPLIRRRGRALQCRFDAKIAPLSRINTHPSMNRCVQRADADQKQHLTVSGTVITCSQSWLSPCGYSDSAVGNFAAIINIFGLVISPPTSPFLPLELHRPDTRNYSKGSDGP